LMSAQAALAGLYPPVTAQLWNPDLPWYPIPVHTKPMDLDRVLNMDLPCTRYTEIENAVYASEEVQKFVKDNKEMLSYIVNKTGLGNVYDDVKLMDIMLSVPQPVMIEKLHGLPYGSWVSDEVYAFLVEMDLRKVSWWYHTDEQKRLRAGRWAHDTLERFYGHVTDNAKSLPKVMIQAAHDNSIVAFLQVMGAWDGLVPPYASYISLELHQLANEEFNIKLFYKNDTASDVESSPVQLYFTDCPSPCSLDTFEEMLKPFLVASDEEHTYLCEPNEFVITIGILITAVGISMLVTGLVIAALGVATWKYKRYQYSYSEMMA